MAIEAGRRLPVASAAHHDVRQAQIDANGLLRLWHGQHHGRPVYGGHQCDVPMATGFLLEGGALGSAHEGLRQAQAHATHLGHLDTVADHRDTLGYAESRCVSLPALEPRIPSATGKEVAEGPPEVGKRRGHRATCKNTCAPT